jgi:hypothetical protein
LGNKINLLKIMSGTINVTAKTLDGTFSMPAELPTDVTIGTFKGAAQAKAGLSSVPCDLILEKNNTVLRDNDTVASANIPDGSVLILAPATEGGF